MNISKAPLLILHNIVQMVIGQRFSSSRSVLIYAFYLTFILYSNTHLPLMASNYSTVLLLPCLIHFSLPLPPSHNLPIHPPSLYHESSLFLPSQSSAGWLFPPYPPSSSLYSLWVFSYKFDGRGGREGAGAGGGLEGGWGVVRVRKFKGGEKRRRKGVEPQRKLVTKYFLHSQGCNR